MIDSLSRAAPPAAALPLRLLALALAGVLGAGAVATTLIYFNYPLEVECMEGTNWIDALAFAEGRNPYTDPGLAFINLNHGPLDAPVKALVTRVLPWLQPWQVIRLPGLLLPLLLVFAARSGRRAGERIPWPWALAAGLGTFFVLEATGNMVVHVGRSDALMLGLLALMIPVGLRVFDEERGRTGPSILLGALAAAAFLENFRAAAVLPSLALVCGFDWRCGRFRARGALAILGLRFLLGAALVFVAVLGGVFHFDFSTYYRYSLGFFSGGPGLSGSSGRLRDLALPFLENKFVALLPLLLVAGLGLRPRSLPTWVRAVALGVPFLLFCAAVGLNRLGAAGGLHYFAPLAIVALLLWRVVPWREAPHGGVLALVLGAGLLGCNWRVVWGNTAHLWHTRREAAAFDAFLHDLDTRYGVESQDVHLFERRVHSTEVDLGFLSFLAGTPEAARTYPKFAQSFAAHEQRLRLAPPAVVAVADFPSAELAARLRAGAYLPVRESPPRFYNAENLTRTRVYLRRDLMDGFTALASPTPTFRSW